jgi:hypothetical protein
MRVLILAAILAGCAPEKPTAVPSHLAGEAAAGVRVAVVRTATPFDFEGGEIVCWRGAIGYRAPAGAIYALNAEGERLAARPYPANRPWHPIENGLKAGATAAEVAAMRELGATTC